MPRLLTVQGKDGTRTSGKTSAPLQPTDLGEDGKFVVAAMVKYFAMEVVFVAANQYQSAAVLSGLALLDANRPSLNAVFDFAKTADGQAQCVVRQRVCCVFVLSVACVFGFAPP